MIIDAKDLIVGRMATVIAKKALLGEKIDIVNCEQAVITGSKREIISRYKQKKDRGIPLQGPYFPTQADRIVRRVIRGMLPYKQHKGAEAYKRVMCYIGIPTEFEKQKLETIELANVSKMPNVKYITIGEISRELK